MKKYAIIVAGGKGLRMGTEVPKQFLPIGGKPVLMRTLEAFHAYDIAMDLIVVLPVDQQAYWDRLCHDQGFAVPHRVADGGATRFHSVRNGLALLGDDGLVDVLVGVRPFVAREVIEACFCEADLRGAVVPVTDVVETVRRVTPEGSVTVNRADYKLVQTPQVFRTALLKSAYRQPYSERFTDDASVVEAMGVSVALVPGNRENIKITTPFDIRVAEALTGCSI